MIYLDNAATTFPKPVEVYDAMDKANRTMAFNAGRGSYAAARAAAQMVDEVRSKISTLLHADACADVVFTPSVTHAFNQIAWSMPIDAQSIIYASPYEHNAVARVLHAISREKGCKVKLLPLASDLKIDMDRVNYAFSVENPSYVFASAVSNVTGYILPAEEIFHAAKKFGAVTLLDAAQAAGLLPIDIERMAVDFACFAGHKTLNGPFGAAGFSIRHGVEMIPLFAGGTGSDSLNLDMPTSAPGRYEAASPNIVALAGLNAALQINNVEKHLETIQNLTQYAIKRLSELSNIQLKGVYEDGDTLGILSLVVDGYPSDEVGQLLAEEYDIAVRTGYHCAPYIHDFLEDKPYHGTVRIGLGQFNTKMDIDAVVEALDSL